MGDMIDADALKAELLRMGFFPAMVKAAIERMPTVDAVPVVHGRWEEYDDYLMNTVYRCSICNEDFVTIDGDPKDNGWNYCPNCGAQMGGEDNDG